MIENLKTMNEIETYLASLTPQRTDPHERLVYVKNVLSLLGNPQDKTPSIHIAGTSGKGSTAYYCASLLQHAGFKVGLTVSPHVNSVTERAQTNGSPLPDDEYIAYFNDFRKECSRLEITLSYIEFLYIFAYWLFGVIALDYIVVEVGLGGLLDPTNAITRSDKVCVITDIGLDHVEILGNTLSEIASQKAGIINSGSTVVMYEQGPEVMGAVMKAVNSNNAQLIICNPSSMNPESLPLYLQRNFSLAFKAVSERLARDDRPALDSSKNAAAAAITIPGRFEKFTYKNCSVILDAAHNPQKIKALTDSLRAAFPSSAFVFVVSFAQNKRVGLQESLHLINNISHHTVITELSVSFGDTHAAVPASEIAGYLTTPFSDEIHPIEALNTAVHYASANTIIIVTGSFFLIDEIRRSLLP